MNESYLHTSTTETTTAYTQKGLTFTRRFSRDGVSPYNETQWEKRTASITDTKGNTIFEQKDVEVPVDWSMTATNIVASKYLHGQTGTLAVSYTHLDGPPEGALGYVYPPFGDEPESNQENGHYEDQKTYGVAVGAGIAACNFAHRTEGRDSHRG